MPRDRFGDADDPRGGSPVPPRKGATPALIIALVAGGVLLLSLIVRGGLMALFWTRGTEAAARGDRGRAGGREGGGEARLHSRRV